jgi:subtilisin family serine protease
MLVMRAIAGGTRHRHRWNRLITTAAALVTILCCAPAHGETPPRDEETQRYIIMLRPTVRGTEIVAGDQVKAHNGKLIGVYKHAFNGYSATFTASAADRLRNSPDVVSVELDAPVTAFGQPSGQASGPAAGQRIGQPARQRADQTVPTGVRRVFAPDNVNLDIDGEDDTRTDVDVAIIDSGVDHDHPDLNVAARTDCTSGSCVADTGDDANGHGTHVAGIAAALDNGVGAVGVAPGARLHSVRVLDERGVGTLSSMAAGMDWITQRAETIEVANLSLGCDGCTSAAVGAAIANAVSRGVVVVAAAGNSAKDAATFFPANHADVITVSSLTDLDGRPGGVGGDQPACRPGSTDRDDSLAATSNHGETIEIAAPGTCIYSTWANGGYNTVSGTSMASPHVAGAAGILAAGADKPYDRTDVQAIRQILLDTGNREWTDDAPDGVKEPLLDVHDPAQYGQSLL